MGQLYAAGRGKNHLEWIVTKNPACRYGRDRTPTVTATENRVACSAGDL